MTLETLREILDEMMASAAIALREAREVGDLEAATRAEVELDTLFRVAAIIDGL